ncbi:hypothetical protein BK004_03560 [bacterium CG10_46_32]|nr:MAG: hypothetical protein BK004_03560 [bacterium CG10_46_32]PIR55929.1 MAG: hypothetical protein COU73_03590 [Parcubacteria group bacterium CG10_big_fil_rev_8_21_14_0_10_46_32]
MPKPLLITLEYPPQHGGIATYLAGEVASSVDSVDIVRGQEHFWGLWPHWLPLVWFRKPASGTVLWISHVLPIGYVALAWKRIFKTPYRVYLHGLDLVRPLKSPWKRFWVKKILQNADEIICNSKATAELLSHYKINSPGVVDRLKIQYPRVPPVDIKQYESSAQALRKQYNLEGKPILLTISRLVKRKGIDVVIRALDEVWKQVPDLVYVVVGDGEERKNLVVIASEATAERGNLNIEKRINTSNKPYGDVKIATVESTLPRNDNTIVFTGQVSDEEKYGWLSACNCFILTPIDDPNDFEGYGIVYKEAQMFNKPVIGSKVGGVPEAVGDNGVLVEPGDIKQIAQAILKYVKP